LNYKYDEVSSGKILFACDNSKCSLREIRGGCCSTPTSREFFFLSSALRAFLLLSKNTHRMKKIKLARTIYAFSAFFQWVQINFLMVVKDYNYLQSFKTPLENVEN